MNILKNQPISRIKYNVVAHALMSVLLLWSAKAQQIPSKPDHVINYSRISQKQKNSINEYTKTQESQQRYKNIPDHEKIPLSYVRIGNTTNEVHPIPNIYGIYFLPNIEFPYQLMKVYQEKLEQYGVKTPHQLLILAQLCKESCLQQVVGDDWKSHGMPQLHKTTAKILLTDPRYKDIFSKYYQLNEKGNPVFFGQEEQIRFLFDYLVLVCNFKPGNEANAITRYNNGKWWFTDYTKGVLIRYWAFILFDLYIKEKNKSMDELFKETKDIIHQKLGGLSDDEVNDIIDTNHIIQSFIAQKNEIQASHLTFNLWEELNAANSQNPMTGKKSYLMFVPEVAGDITYILKKDIFTLYSVFQDQYREAMEFHNNIVSDEKQKIKFYVIEQNKTTKKNERVTLTSKEQVNNILKKGKEINTVTPDTIYIQSGSKIYNYQNLPPYPLYLKPYIHRSSWIHQ